VRLGQNTWAPETTLFLHSFFTFDAACASVYIDCVLRREAEDAGGRGGGGDAGGGGGGGRGGGGRFIQEEEDDIFESQSDQGGGGEVSDVMQAVGTISVSLYDAFIGMAADDSLCAKVSLYLAFYLSIYLPTYIEYTCIRLKYQLYYVKVY